MSEDAPYSQLRRGGWQTREPQKPNQSSTPTQAPDVKRQQDLILHFYRHSESQRLDEAVFGFRLF